MNRYAKLFPWIVLGLFSLWAVGKMMPKKEIYKDFNLTQFGSIPVLDGGRLKPLDSVARTNMLFISGRSEFEDLDGNMQPAILWLLEVFAAGDPNVTPGCDYKVFRIDNEQLLGELGLEYRPGSYRYSWNELRKAADRFDKVFIAAQAKEEKKDRGEKVPEEVRDIFHGKVIELGRRLRAYERLASRDNLTVVPKEKGSETWLTLAEVDQLAGQSFAEEARQQASKELIADLQARGMDPNEMTPGIQAAVMRDLERRTKQRIKTLGARERKSVCESASAFGDILSNFKANKPAAFAEAISSYKADYVYPLNPSIRDTSKFEQEFNYAAPFYYAAFFYIFAGICGALSWLGWSEPFRRAGVGLALAALVLTVAGLLGRMYIMGRPLVFVTNLYSSALLIGAGAVGACLYLEKLFRNGVGLVVGTTIGAVTVKIAHHLSTDGNDTLGQLVAVLDTNFWLASHVTTVTLGYAATYIAGFLGVTYILWGLFFTTLTKEKHIAVGNMIYGITCFATMLSFVGTVLGGIWADQSWGRFWGWDPKENGAVLIVIWNSLILHARWGGMVKQRGMAMLAVVGIMVTTWSWFGTNQLGVGLHNYGFNKSLADGCRWTWILSMMVIAIGAIPLRYWRSFSGTGEPRSESPAIPVSVPLNAPTLPVTAQAAPTVVAPAPNVTSGNQPKPDKGKRGKKR